MNVPNLSQPGLTEETRAVPSSTPGARPITIGSTRRHTVGSAARLTHNTYALSATSIGTSAGLSTRLVRNNSASGTVMDENP
jgi:hypothetical protein